MQPNDPSSLPVGLHRDALRSLPAPALIMDPALRIVFANAAFEVLSGYGLPELLQEGRRILQDRGADGVLRDALDRGRGFRGEVLLLRKDGAPLRRLLTLAPVPDPRSTATYFVGVMAGLPDRPDTSSTIGRGDQERDAASARSAEGRRGSRPDFQKLETDLRGALDRDEIVAYFQPQYDSLTGALTGYEALARWHHPVHGTVPPDRFIPLAEADGLIAGLGAEMLEQACRFADLVAAGRPLRMEVNVSVEQLRIHGLAEGVRRLLDEYPHRTWSLTVEVTESALVLDHGLARAELEQLRDLGVGVSIDDFGSGYSSLSRLRDLPATELKIDRSFVHREDAVGTSLLTAIVALAGSLGLLVVAEGIETGSQLATARALRCDRLQGMYLCPPLGPEEVLAAPPDIAGLLLAID